jgi:hypothetical protein
MAEADHAFDRGVLREFLSCADYDTAAVNCMDRFVWLERYDGLLFCVHRFYQELSESFPDNGWIFQGLVRALNERDGPEVAAVALQDVRSRCSELDRLMALSEIYGQRSVPESKENLDYPTVRTSLDPARGFPRTWVRTASKADLVQAADDLLTEHDEQKLWRYLQVFGTRAFPRPAKEIFRFLDHSNRRIAGSALRLLRRLTDPDVRTLALATISEGTLPERAIRLLVNNFRPGDLKAIETMIRKADLDEQSWHGVGLAVLDLLDHASVSAVESRSLLLQLYEETPCTLCRQGFVAKLHSRGMVPDWMAVEVRFDAEPGTAELFTNPG